MADSDGLVLFYLVGCSGLSLVWVCCGWRQSAGVGLLGLIIMFDFVVWCLVVLLC